MGRNRKVGEGPGPPAASNSGGNTSPKRSQHPKDENNNTSPSQTSSDTSTTPSANAVPPRKRKQKFDNNTGQSPTAKKPLINRTPDNDKTKCTPESSSIMSGVISGSDISETDSEDEITPNQNPLTTTRKLISVTIASDNSDTSDCSLNMPKSLPCIQTPAINLQAPSTSRPTPTHQTARVDLNAPTYLANLPESTRHIILTSTTEKTTLTKLNPILLQKAIDNICGPVADVDYLRSGSLRIKTHTLEQVHTLLKLKIFTPANITVSVNVAWTKQLSFGKLYAPELKDMTLDMLLETLKPHNVVGIRRLLNDPNRSSVPLFVLTFLGTTCPSKIKVGYCIYTIDKYYPNPTRCSHCCRYGHQTSNCNSLQICSRCSEKGHKHTSCTAPSPKCANCHGAHEVIDRNCPIFLREKQVCQMVVDFGIKPSEARSRLTSTPTQTAPHTTTTNTPILVPSQSQQQRAYPTLPSLTQLIQSSAPTHHTALDTVQPSTTQNGHWSYSTAVRSNTSIHSDHTTETLSPAPTIVAAHTSSHPDSSPALPDDCSYLSPHPAPLITATATPMNTSGNSQPHSSHTYQHPTKTSAFATLLPIILQWLPLLMKLLLATSLTDKVECFLELGDLLGARSQVSSMLSQLELSSASNSQNPSQ